MMLFGETMQIAVQTSLGVVFSHRCQPVLVILSAVMFFSEGLVLGITGATVPNWVRAC